MGLILSKSTLSWSTSLLSSNSTVEIKVNEPLTTDELRVQSYGCLREALLHKPYYISCNCWIITILYNHTKGTLSLVLVPAFISIGISVYSIINPRKLWPFGLLATFWGLMYIYMSGKIPGFLLFILGCFAIAMGEFCRCGGE